MNMDSSLNSNPIFYVIALFDEKEKNWTTLEHLFKSEQEAQEYVNQYPRAGDQHSRAIREGNWQIVKYIN